MFLYPRHYDTISTLSHYSPMIHCCGLRILQWTQKTSPCLFRINPQKEQRSSNFDSGTVVSYIFLSLNVLVRVDVISFLYFVNLCIALNSKYQFRIWDL